MHIWTLLVQCACFLSAVSVVTLPWILKHRRAFHMYIEIHHAAVHEIGKKGLIFCALSQWCNDFFLLSLYTICFISQYIFNVFSSPPVFSLVIFLAHPSEMDQHTHWIYFACVLIYNTFEWTLLYELLFFPVIFPASLCVFFSVFIPHLRRARSYKLYSRCGETQSATWCLAERPQIKLIVRQKSFTSSNEIFSSTTHNNAIKYYHFHELNKECRSFNR